jgi:hypothetical protein
MVSFVQRPLKTHKGVVSFLNAEMRHGAYSHAASSSGLDPVRFRAASMVLCHRNSNHTPRVGFNAIFSRELSTPQLAVGRGGYARVRRCRGRLLHTAA